MAAEIISTRLPFVCSLFWQLVRGHDAPESNRFIGDLTTLGERLLLLHS